MGQTNPAAIITPSLVTASDTSISVRGYALPANGPYSVAVRTGAGTTDSPYRYSNAVSFTVGWPPRSP